MEEQAEWCNLVYLADWGDWGTPSGRQGIADRIVQQLGDARTLGFRKAVVCVGFLCFDSAHRSYLGTSEVQRFRQRISDAGLLDLIVGVSVLDEPDLVPGMTGEVMTIAYRDVKAAWGPSVALVAIHGDHGYPGGAEVDWIATDRYDLQDGVLGHLPALHGAQRHLLVCGGASPYRNAPEPFYAFAQAHPEVVGILCFIFGDYTGVKGESEQGIANNGMLERFKAVGRRIIAN
jgi:hypothetical protein